VESLQFFSIWWHAPALFLIGTFAGVNNVLAGGGSLVTMPVLIFFGMDAGSANGSNRVAIAIQNVFAVAGFQQKGFGDWRFSMLLVLPALPGVILGAIVASTISDDLFKKVLSVVMIMVLCLILTKRSKKQSGEPVTEKSVTRFQMVTTMFLFMGVGFYSGFIQAGVGFLVMGIMTATTGMDLVRINAQKVMVIGVCTWVALFIFAYFGKIIWSVALVLSAGNALGGWLGSKAAVAGGEKWIKRVLTVAVLAMAIKLSGIHEWVFQLLR
jgi:uncharacterized protein